MGGFVVTVGLHLLLMLGKSSGEASVAVGVADKVEEGGLCRGDGSPEGGDAGATDGTGRKAGVLVGIVGRGRVEVGAVDGAAITSLEQGGVDDGGVGFKRHLAGETVDKDAGDQGTLFLDAHFLFNEGGKGHDAGDICITVWVEAKLRGGLSEAPDHGRQHLGRRGMAGEAVGGRKEEPFKGGGVGGNVGDESGVLAGGSEEGVVRAQTGRFGGMGDVEEVVALGQGEGQGKGVAVTEAGGVG